MDKLTGIISSAELLGGQIVGMRGLKGDKGDKGDTGESATIAVGTVTTGDAGTDASVVNVGDNHDAVFNFTIPKGDKGDTGATGDVNTYIAEYGTATYADIGDAITEGKYVIAVKDNNYYPLVMFSNSSYVFSYIHENICYEVVCDSYSTWTARTHTSVRDVKQNGASVTTSGVALVTVPTATSTTPKMDGTASAGSETTWAKGDHIHPSDTSKADVGHTHIKSDITDFTHTHTKSEITDFPDIHNVPSGGTKGQVLTKDSSTDYDASWANPEVTLATLESLMPTDTASGAIASFPDGQNVFPLKSLVADIDPVQDLHGYDAPWVGGAGKNKLPYVVGGTSGDATAVVSSDGSVTLNGTGYARFYTDYFTVPAGTYILNGNTDYPNTVIYLDGVSGSSDINTGAIITFSEETTVRGVVQIYANITVSNLTLKPMLRKSTESSTYEPYSNICPISGHDDVDVSVCGINVWDEELEQGDIATATGLPITADYGFRTKNFIPVLPNTQYYNKCPSRAEYARLWYYDADKNFISYNGGRANDLNAVITTPQNAYYMKFTLRYASYGTTYNNDVSINYPSTDTDYHAYNGNTYTTTLPETVYGGTLDLVSGELTVDRAVTVFDGSSDEDWVVYGGGQFVYCRDLRSIAKRGTNVLAPSGLTSNMFVPRTSSSIRSNYIMIDGDGDLRINTDAFNIASITDTRAWLSNNNLQVCYELATPQTYQLTPQQIQTLLGQNNVWANSGDVEVIYKADIQKWVEKKTDELNTAILALA